MSDYILKLWPINEASESKTALIVQELRKIGFLGNETEHWGKKAFTVGTGFKELFQLNPVIGMPALSDVRVEVKELDYGVEDGDGDGDGDIDTVERRNMVLIYEGSDFIENWNLVTKEIERITGDKYKGNWEIL